jgi:hypothetical protein
MGNSWLRSLRRQRLCLRLRGADPAFHPFGGVAQTSRALACQARGRRFESGRPRSHGGRGVTEAPGVVSPVGAGSNPVGHLMLAAQVENPQWRIPDRAKTPKGAAPRPAQSVPNKGLGGR